MTIERIKGELVFRIPGNLNVDDLQDFIDYLKYRSIARKTKATQQQVNVLVKSAKRGRLDRTKARLGL